MNDVNLYLVAGLLLVVVGLAGALLRRDLLRIIIGFSIVDTGVHLVIASLGWRPDGRAPIVDSASLFAGATGGAVRPDAVVDPVPQALVLTAIVIGVGVTALMLAYAVRLHAAGGSLDLGRFGRLKW